VDKATYDKIDRRTRRLIMPDIITKDSLPSDPSTWPQHRKKVLARMIRIDGEFTVQTKEGPLTCPDGWLAVDSAGWPYPVSRDDYAQMYELVNVLH